MVYSLGVVDSHPPTNHDVTHENVNDCGSVNLGNHDFHIFSVRNNNVPCYKGLRL